MGAVSLCQHAYIIFSLHFQSFLHVTNCLTTSVPRLQTLSSLTQKSSHINRLPAHLTYRKAPNLASPSASLAIMSILSNPRTLYFTRITQFLFSVGFLILICYSGVHRGWWTSIDGPLAVGVITSIFTFALTLHNLITHHMNSNPFSGGSATRTIIRLAAEAVVFLLWIATAVLMLRPKGGCPDENPNGFPIHDPKNEEGMNTCQTSETSGRLWSDQPRTEWNVAVAFDFVEIVAFILSALLVFKDDRASKVSGGTSYA